MAPQTTQAETPGRGDPHTLTSALIDKTDVTHRRRFPAGWRVYHVMAIMENAEWWLVVYPGGKRTMTLNELDSFEAGVKAALS